MSWKRRVKIDITFERDDGELVLHEEKFDSEELQGIYN